MFSIKDAAQALGIHPKTLRRWEESGKFIPQRTLGNQRRFTQKDLNTLKNIKSGQLPPEISDPILTPQQTAAKLGISLMTLNRWTKAGKISYKLDRNLQPGYLSSQINSLFKSEVQPLKPPPNLPVSRVSSPHPVLAYAITALILSLSTIIYLIYKNKSVISQPTPVDIQQITAPAPLQTQTANFLSGRITIGSDTGDLAFLDEKGNLYLKNSALIEGGIYTNSLQLLPTTEPEGQIGRQYVNKATGNLMYFDGLGWQTLNQSTESASSAFNLNQTSFTLDDHDFDLNLGDQTASASAASLRLTLAGPNSQFSILGGANQEIITFNDDLTYPVLISQPTKILGNLYTPKLIDTDSETYFLDPSATGLGLSLAGDATISGTLTFSKNGEFITNTTDNYLIFSGGLSVGGTTNYGFNSSGNINANKIDAHDVIQIDNLKLDNNTLSATNNDGIYLYDNDSNGMFIQDAGNVGIGTTAPVEKLEVAGNIRVTGGGFIDDGTTLLVPDYVFEPDYPLLSPVDLADYVHIQKHLPGVPSSAEIRQNGLNLSQTLLLVLAKTEENVLYLLDLYDRVTTLEQRFLSPTVTTEKLTTNFISPLSSDGQITVTGDTSISGTLTAKEINSSTIDHLKAKLAAIVDQLGREQAPSPPDNIATISALLANLTTPAPAATDSAYLSLDQINASAGFFSDYLAVIGQTTLTDLKVNNQLSLNSINSLDGKLTLLAGLMTLDESGQVVITGNLTVTGTIIASQITPPLDQTLDISIASSSALLIYSDINQPIATFSGQTTQISQLELKQSGTATISAGTNNVIIPSTKLTEKSQIIITFSADYKPATKYWVTKEPELNQFTIFTNYPVNNSAPLAWLIIN
ncbi:MAG: helix-turn-helix domain-containing protein [Candidatus Beckwithbacteria bacterium]